jgi:hypothetical protein
MKCVLDSRQRQEPEIDRIALWPDVGVTRAGDASKKSRNGLAIF